MNSTVGLAYVGGMCSSKVSCTISEGTSFSASYIAAHEIGHSLSMPHDGDVGSWDCEGNKYLMSSVMSSGATTWSSCSKDALVGFLFSGKGSCLTSTKDFDEPRRGHAGKLPGKRFGASEQCRYMYGSDWDFFSSTESPFNNVCKEIWCRNGRKLRTPSASALEGTPCGPLKICIGGSCVTDELTDTDGDEGEADIVLEVSGGSSNETCRAKEEDCNTFSNFLGSLLGSSFSSVFNSIFTGLGMCDEMCDD
ncbi:A disintegrin and metalloproteinase with thrombospondin motifs 5-like isoform X3 [Penaeus japonicus]|uniref:A disintegrin and metalloproteinase with thrombospondin motifs 5-like isoform X3 n=1 Tax=Penaeus japonicus TaxID=27405 RepID=UPI001C70F395|nr:A disintegrin and metalloproteinase with thrombospondin motifs 5-like isoform X3 [Penaeus japonicus]